MTESILITGAAKRIGRQLALDLAAAGHDIAIHCNTSRDAAAEVADGISAMGCKAVIVQGDPIADWQWNNLRPVSSLLVNGAGFIAIHGQGDGAYGHLDGSKNAKGVVLITNAGNPDTLTSVDGNTTYQVYDTYHPLAMLSAMIYDSLGLKYSQADLEECAY